MGAAPGFAVFLDAAARAMRPRRRLSVSEWADLYRVLSSKGSGEPGRWRTSRTPYLREPLDCLSLRSPVRETVLMFSTQRGKTEVALNWLGYIIAHAQAPTLCVVPTLEVRKRWVRQRLDPMLSETPALAEIRSAQARRDGGNAEDMKDFPGGFLVVGGANSPASLASMPICNVIYDEVDLYPEDVGGKGDVFGLVSERQQNFTQRKTLIVSSPSIRGASLIEDAYLSGDRRQYHVPCPHCATLQVLVWKQLSWDSKLTEARYICIECGAEMHEYHKQQMLDAGRWVASNHDSPTWRRSYHLNKLYSPIALGSTWIDLARDWVSVQSDKVKLKRFINTSLAETWEDDSGKVEPHVLATRGESYKLREIPPGCLALTAGIDTQDQSLAITILGWGAGQHWIIDWAALHGDTSRDEVWKRLAAYLTQPMINSVGREMRVMAAVIDRGGHRTAMVDAFAHEHRARRWVAGAGSRYYGKSILASKPRKIDSSSSGKTLKHGWEYWEIGTDNAKSQIYGWIAGDAGKEPDARRLRFSEDLTDTYYKELTAEVYDPETNRWRKRAGRRNEALDTLGYAIAAGWLPSLRLHKRTRAQWAAEASLIETSFSAPAASPTPADDKAAHEEPTYTAASRQRDLMARIRARRL